LYGSDYHDLKWVRESLMRLELQWRDSGTSEQDRADLDKARAILERAKTIATFYNPDQPRDAHGWWTSGGTLKVPKAIAKLEKAAGDRSSGKCATKVVDAIEAGGVAVRRTKFAKDYGPNLLESGFDEKTKASAGQGYPPNKDYRPQAGDVVVIRPSNSAHPDGHMAMFNGKQWVSDYWQVTTTDDPTGFWPGASYRTSHPSYVIYRPKRTATV